MFDASILSNHCIFVWQLMFTGLNSCIWSRCKSLPTLRKNSERTGQAIFLGRNFLWDEQSGKLTFGLMQRKRKRNECMHDEPKKSLVAVFSASYLMLVNILWLCNLHGRCITRICWNIWCLYHVYDAVISMLLLLLDFVGICHSIAIPIVWLLNYLRAIHLFTTM